jgi:hypothetical protein
VALPGINNLRAVNIVISSTPAIVGNTSGGESSATEGGGIILLSGSLAINSSTISGNTVVANPVVATGGIWVPSNTNAPTVNIQNSIVANNTGGNCSGVMVSDGYNLSSDGTCNFNAPGDLINTDPKLGPLLEQWRNEENDGSSAWQPCN